MTSLFENVLGGLLGGTIVLALTAVAVSLPAVRRRPALASAMWLVVLVRFAFPVQLTTGISIESTLAQFFGGEAWIFGAPELVSSSPALSQAPGAGLWVSILAFGWISIASALLLTAVIRAQRTHSRLRGLPMVPEAIARRAERLALELGLRRTPRVVLGSETALSAGILRPVVALPNWLSGAALDHVLAHELAHIARRDPLWALLASAARSLVFFWPPAWFASRKFAAAREQACDVAAISACSSDSRDYARTLLDVSTRLVSASAALAMAARPSQLTRRITGLLSGRLSGMGAVGVLVLGVQIAVGLPGSAKDAEAASTWGECIPSPGLRAKLMNDHPEADRDGDGVLTRAEVCAFERRLRSSVRESIDESPGPMCIEEFRCTEVSSGGDAAF